LGPIGHFYKPEAAQTSTELIANQIHFTHRSILSKSLSQVILTGTKGEVSHVDIQARVRPFGNVISILGPYYNNQTQAGAALEAGFLSAAAQRA